MLRPTLFFRVAVASCSALIGSFAALPCRGESQRVISVEEHWELRVSEPDTDRSAPQITMTMSPTNSMDGVHFLFTLNHFAAPEYAAGGLESQLWNGEQFVASKGTHEGHSLEHSNETLTWTQRITLHDGQLTFQVVGGDSQSWGNFGGDGLTLQTSSSLASLNGYRPAVSLSESQVGYAENRVVSLVLTKLVWVTDDGQVHEQNAPIPLDISLDE